MKIDNTGKPPSSTVSKVETRQPKAASVDAAPKQHEENVQINAFSSKLAKLEGQLGTQSEVNEAKVAQIRQAIKDGRFNVRADAIADKLLMSVKELLANG